MDPVSTLAMAYKYPLLLFGLLVVFAILAVWLLPKLLRAIVAFVARLCSWVGVLSRS